MDDQPVIMHQTGYLPIAPFSLGLFYHGGFEKWWYAKREDIASWPNIDPLTQMLATAPTLVTGATWKGPIVVPDRKLGYTETQEASKAGTFYNQKVFGWYPGQDANSDANLENMPYHEFVIIGKLRAGGYYKVFGTDESGLLFDHEYNSGEGSLEAAGSKFVFSKKSQFKALTLLSFSGTPATNPPNYVGPTTPASIVDMEKIEFTNVSTVPVSWTSNRRTRFGDFPAIEVWIEEAGSRYRYNGEILVDLPPPATTTFTINIGGPATGFVIIK